MEKASRVLRRSGVKLLSLGGANSDLSVTLSEVKNMRSSAKAFMHAQNLATRDMLRWAAHEENRAIQDVFNQMSELNLLWTEVQTEYLDSLKEYRQMFEMILAGEKQVFLAKQNYNVCEQKESKYRKEHRRLIKKGGLDSEIRMIHSRIQQAERSRDLAYSELSDKAKENECIKLARLKAGLLKVTEAYIEMSTKCSLLFTAQRDVVLQLPEVNGQDPDELKYTGRTTTRYIVDQARNQIKKYSRNSQSGTNLNEPPPPYTPTPPGSSPNLPAEQTIVPVRNPTPPAPRTSQPDRNTPPRYEEVNASTVSSSDARRLERRSLPPAFETGNETNLTGSEPSLTGSMSSMSSGAWSDNTVSRHDTVSQPSLRVITQPIQESCSKKAETLPRTGSGSRIVPRYPAPPIPHPRTTSVASSDSSGLSSCENLANAGKTSVGGSTLLSPASVFTFDSRDVATQSPNTTCQCGWLYSSVRSNSPVHVCPSGLSSPSVLDHVENNTKSQIGTTGLQESCKQNKEEIQSLVKDCSSDVQTPENVPGSGERNASNTENCMAEMPKHDSEMLQTTESLETHQGNSTSKSKDDLHNIPFMDSTDSEGLSEIKAVEKNPTFNKQTDQGTNIGAMTEIVDSGVQDESYNEKRQDETKIDNLGKSANSGLLETNLDAWIAERYEEKTNNAHCDTLVTNENASIKGGENEIANKSDVHDTQQSHISAKDTSNLIDLDDYDEEYYDTYDTTGEENVTIGAVGGVD